MLKKSKLVRHYFLVLTLLFISFFIALPSEFTWKMYDREIHFVKDRVIPTIFGHKLPLDIPMHLGLDIAGGVQLTLEADMSDIASEDRLTALESAVEIVRQRVDAYGLSEPIIQTATSGDNYRIIVEVPGMTDVDQAVSLIGTTAMMDFRLQDATKAAALAEASAAATIEDQLYQYYAYLDSFNPTPLQGNMLERATASLDPQTNQQIVSLQFTPEGKDIFAQITKDNVGRVLGIFIDDYPIMAPSINQPILDGNAMITGGFTREQARALAVQLNSGALPVPLQVLSQSQVGASLGEDSVRASIYAGVIGLILVAIFMVLNYATKGLIADFGLLIYCLIIIALYKIFGVTLTLPSIAALLISMGMAVDSNILVFSRMKEEEQLGQSRERARELSFGRAMDSIKDANFITIMIALILINPLDLSFLNSSGTIRGFGITLLMGVLVGLFTGIYVTRILTRAFLYTRPEVKSKQESPNET